jgi:2-dehydro-3-deoxygluconokinase
MARIVTFGEIMMRLQAPSYKRLTQAETFDVYFGGSEANTAAALAQWGEHAVYVTKLPENDLGEACLRSLRAAGVDTSYISRGNGRLGVYYTERGASQRPPQVLYDRAGSAFALSEPSDFDFEAAFKGSDWFHFSGITPALGGHLPELTRAAVRAARNAGCRISCDFNFRSKLWSAEDARRTLSGLIEGLDLLIINENQAGEILGVDNVSLEATARELVRRYNLPMAAVTKRRTVSGEVNEFSALLYRDGQCFESRTYSIFMIEKIGGGDAFSAGLLYSLLQGKDPQETVDFAVAAAVFKHTAEGDMLAASAADIEWVMRSDGNGRMTR